MRKVLIGEEEVTIDPSILDFGETNLNEFLQKIGSHHAYFAEKHADATWILGLYKQTYDEVYSKSFRELKGSGNAVPVPVAQAAAKSDEAVRIAGEKVLAAEHNKDLIGGFLKSIDKTFQAAMNYGYNRRKEMDKLHHDISISPHDDPDERMAQVLAEDSK